MESLGADSLLINGRQNNSLSYSTNKNLNLQLVASRKLSSRGNSVTVQARYRDTDSDSESLSTQNVTLYRPSTADSIYYKNRYNLTPGDNKTFSLTGTYSERLSKYSFLQLRYMYQYSHRTSERSTYDFFNKNDYSMFDGFSNTAEWAYRNFNAFTDPYAPLSTYYSDSLSRYSEYNNYTHEIELTWRRVTNNYNLNLGIMLQPQTQHMIYDYLGKHHDVQRSVTNFTPTLDFRYRFTLVSKDWMDSFIDGAVPKDAVKARFYVGFDVPNVPEGDYMAISEVSIVQKTEKHPFYKDGSFVSLPYFTNERYVDMACSSIRQEGSYLYFLKSTAPDVDGIPGEWTKFVNCDADDTGRHPGRIILPNGHSWFRYKVIIRSHGTTPRLKSVTIDDRIDKDWTYSIFKSPSISMLSKSPNQDPASEIRFKLLEDTIISWPTVRYLLDDVDITAKTTRNGSIISYKPAEPLKPVPPSLSPRTWAFHNYQNVLKMYNLQDSRSAVRVTRLAEEQDSSFYFKSQPLAVKGGEIYTLRYKIRHNNNLEKADDRSHITWLTNSNQPIGDPIIIRYGKPLTDWTEKAITLAAPENAALVVIQFGFDVPNIKKNEYFDLDVVAFDGPRPADAVA
ncbi:MAG: hypothetical protein J6W23_07790, partial [Victivallales bacterium]|nr:hypothetical protein [Victivallales bacterium]